MSETDISQIIQLDKNYESNSFIENKDEQKLLGDFVSYHHCQTMIFSVRLQLIIIDKRQINRAKPL